MVSALLCCGETSPANDLRIRRFASQATREAATAAETDFFGALQANFLLSSSFSFLFNLQVKRLPLAQARFCAFPHFPPPPRVFNCPAIKVGAKKCQTIDPSYSSSGRRRRHQTLPSFFQGRHF